MICRCCSSKPPMPKRAWLVVEFPQSTLVILILGSFNHHHSFVTGTIPRNRVHTFERILWRVLRGNLYMNTAEIDEPLRDSTSDEMVKKVVFIVFAHGKELIGKIRKISESIGATVYPIDPSASKRAEHMLEVGARLEDLNSVLFNTNATRRAELVRVAENLSEWTVFVKKEKGVYHALNLFNFDNTRKCLIAEGWCPTSAMGSIQSALNTASERSGSMIPPILNEMRTFDEPPTFHKTNKFTKGFQTIVDAYGMARYKEVNPGLYTIISFPFLFAVMFGDFGHGSFMAAIGLTLVLNERKFQNNSNEVCSCSGDVTY
jgi:V-type H+-transporting ATPase subunit a